MAPSIRLLAAPAILTGAVVLAYANALGGVFQFDDFAVIVDNPAVRSLAAWASGPLGIRPLLKASYTLNWVLGPGPLGFHVLNLAIHAANTLMVWRLFTLLARKPGAQGESAHGAVSPWAALAGALVFALHPVQTEAVTYICGRSSSLMAFFYLGALLAYGRGRATDSRIWRQAISGGLFILTLNARAYNNLGWALVRAGDRPGARLAYHKALLLKPDDRLARINLQRLVH